MEFVHGRTIQGQGCRTGSQDFQGLARAEPLRIAFFTSPMALVMRISRGQASVQLKIVRQRQYS
jgi:hypothetical protein